MIGVEKEEARRREPEAPTGDRVVYTGFVSCFDEEAPHLLQCADLAIAPFVDGLSARRGSTITMMAQSLPIISTRGPLTDMEVFDSSPIRLLPVGDEAGFIGTLEELVRSPELRARLGSDTRLFFERHFGWDVIAKRVADVAATAA
jgi:glycosyltransferase involved in cell wall biosynthesis